MAYDLTHGLWQHGGEKRTVQFDEDGTAIIFDNSGESLVAHFLVWELINRNGLIYLALVTEDAALPEEYLVTTNCEGIELYDPGTQALSQWYYHPISGTSKVSEISNNLNGEWSLYASSSGMNTPRVAYFRFSQDHRFTQVLDNGAGPEKQEMGLWELSINGKYLLLHTCPTERPGKCFATSVYAITYCDGHSLLLKPAQNNSGYYHSNLSIFSFVK